MRINKYLASIGISSRRKIDKLIQEKKVYINNKLADIGMEVEKDDDIKIDGIDIKKFIENQSKVYFILNKPLEILASVSDDRNRKTVTDLIKTEKRIFPIGRLDYMTSGLIILTNDGELFNRLVHPKSKVYKTYYVEFIGKIKEEEIKKIKSGIDLEDGKTLPAKISSINFLKNRTSLLISIREGRNRQIRRMFSYFGYNIVKLRREKIGELSLGNLKEGEYRELTTNEINYLYSL